MTSIAEWKGTAVDVPEQWHAHRVVVFGGAGFIGTALAEHLSVARRCQEIVLVDLRPPSMPLPAIARFVRHDVRQPIPPDIAGGNVDWIFNLAAVHREPGHSADEYFATNVMGAQNVCCYADRVDCHGIYFTSSIACYGTLPRPSSPATALQAAWHEESPLLPTTPYGRSKKIAESIHADWQARGPDRRLVVVRPGAVYGPGDPGNILRMIHAVQRGWFCFAGSPDIRKSCCYVRELMATVDFMLARRDACLVYNLAEPETPTLRAVVATISREFGASTRVVRLPRWVLMGLSWLAQRHSGGRSALHPVRVRKASTATHVAPVCLLRLGYRFRYDFASALRDWRTRAPHDFFGDEA